MPDPLPPDYESVVVEVEGVGVRDLDATVCAACGQRLPCSCTPEQRLAAVLRLAAETPDYD